MVSWRKDIFFSKFELNTLLIYPYDLDLAISQRINLKPFITYPRNGYSPKLTYWNDSNANSAKAVDEKNLNRKLDFTSHHIDSFDIESFWMAKYHSFGMDAQLKAIFVGVKFDFNFLISSLVTNKFWMIGYAGNARTLWFSE